LTRFFFFYLPLLPSPKRHEETRSKTHKARELAENKTNNWFKNLSVWAVEALKRFFRFVTAAKSSKPAASKQQAAAAAAS